MGREHLIMCAKCDYCIHVTLTWQIRFISDRDTSVHNPPNLEPLIQQNP